MAQTNYTPIALYYSTTAAAVPTSGNLVPGELGLNINDMKLYCENSAGTVTLLASASATGDVTGPASSTNAAIPTFGNTSGKLIQNNSGATIAAGIITATGFSGPHNGTVGATTPASGAFTTVSATTAIPATSGGTGVSAVGASGNVLTSNGTNWVSSVPASSSGTGLKSIQYFTTAGSFTWTRPSGITLIKVAVIGGGACGIYYSEAAPAPGGGAGGTSQLLLDVTAIASVGLVVGAGGVAANPVTGAGNGGNSSFGTYAYGNGGSASSSGGGYWPGGVGGTATTGNLNMSGQRGVSHYGGGGTMAGGSGGFPTLYGRSGGGGSYGQAGEAGLYGGGGGGGGYGGAGGNGGSGIIVVEEY